MVASEGVNMVLFDEECGEIENVIERHKERSSKVKKGKLKNKWPKKKEREETVVNKRECWKGVKTKKASHIKQIRKLNFFRERSEDLAEDLKMCV